MLRAIIIDDESIGVDTLKVLLEEYIADIKVVATATNPLMGVELVENYRPDIVFLDIAMPKIDGFQFLEKLNYKDFKLIFTTAHLEFAFKAIKNKAFDYLLKPIDLDDLRICVEKIKTSDNKIKSNPDSLLSPIIKLSVSDGIIFVKQEEIIRLQAEGNYTTFYLINKVEHLVSRKIGEYEQILNPALFYRCHRSHIVNLKKVVKMVSKDGLFAQMTDGSMPEIGRSNKEMLLEKLSKL